MVFLALVMPGANAQEIPDFVFGEVPDLVLISNTDQCGSDIICETVYEVCDPTVTPVDISIEFFDGEKKEIGQLIRNKDLQIDIVDPPCKQFTIRGEKSPFNNIDNMPCIKGICDDRFTWWNATFPYRTSYNITVSDGSTLTDFQVFMNVTHELEMQEGFGDLRFTSSDGVTELSYCVGDDCGIDYSKTDGEYTDVVIKVDTINTTIFKYYGNALVSTTGNSRDTFVAWDNFDNSYGSEQWTEIDPLNHTVIDRTINERLEITNLSRDEDTYIYMSGDIDFPTWRKVTLLMSNPASAEAIGIVCGTNEIDDLANTDNATCSSFNEDRYQSLRKLNLVYGSGSTVSVSDYSNPYYLTFTDDGIEMTLTVFSDSTRTTVVGYSNYTHTTLPTNLDYIYALISFDSGDSRTASGWMDDIEIRKYHDPEPIVSPPGLIEEVEVEINVTCDPELIRMCEPFGEWDNAVCLDDYTLQKTKNCLIEVNGAVCSFNKTEIYNCDNGCYDSLSAIGSGCSPTDMELMGYVAVIFVIFIIAVSFLTRGKKRRKR